MAQRFTTQDGVTITVPGTVVSQRVISTVTNTGISGAVTLIGEAEQGPHWSEEEDLSQNGFAPDQLNAVVAKYGSGKLVDAFRATVSANADSQINGAVQVIYLVKTNQGTKASADILRSGLSGTYSALQARLAGKPGNDISVQHSTEVLEIGPSLSNVGLFRHPTLTSSPLWRVNGGAELAIAIPAVSASVPSSLVTNFEAQDLNGILAQGGVARSVLPGGAPTLSTAISSGDLVVSLSSGSWAVTPVAGNIALIPSTSSIAGAGSGNVGTYRVVSATSASVTLDPVNVTGPLDGTVTAASQSVPLAAIECYTSVTISNMSGMQRNVLSLVGDILSINNQSASISVISYQDSGSVAKLFAAVPRANDLVYSAADYPSASGLRKGWYKVTSAVNATQGQVTLQRLSNGDLTVGTTTYTLPNLTNIKFLKPDIDGSGKALEYKQDTNAATIVKSSVDLVSVPNQMIFSTAERRARSSISRPSSPSPQAEAFVYGGNVILSLGYEGATCALSISSAGLLTTVASNVADNLSVDLTAYQTMQQLIDFLNSRPRYSAAISDSLFTNMSPSLLDEVSSIGIASSTSGNKAGRIKRDAEFFKEQLGQSSMVEVDSDDLPSAGLPDIEELKFLISGAKGATSGAAFLSAIDACEIVPTNFMVSLIDQSAAADIAESSTDAASSYDIDAVNNYMRSHVIAMSAVKARKNRSALVSVRRSYAASKTAARDLSHPRVSLAWAQIKDTASDGSIKTLPCWAMACKAAGQSAAAGFKGIVKKRVSMTGVIYPAGFDPRKTGDLEDALQSGLLLIERVNTGGFRWVSDQTTYNTDQSFLWNSIQAVYLADLITLTLIQNCDTTIVGQSVALQSAALIRGFIASQMANFMRLRWIAPSDDAPLGYRDLVVKLNGSVVEISVNVKLAGLIYFVSIDLALSEVTQTA